MQEPFDFTPENMQKFQQRTQQLKTLVQDSQTKSATTEIIGQAGDGKVIVTMVGNYMVKKVYIDPTLLTKDKSLLEELVLQAINAATNKVGAFAQQEVLDILGSMQE